MLKGSLLETQETLKVYHPVPQEKDVLRTTVDVIVHHFPLLGEDHVILLDHVLDPIGSG